MCSIVNDDFVLVDEWMLWERFKEEISQTENEMCTYMESIDRHIRDLTDSVNLLLGTTVILFIPLSFAIIILNSIYCPEKKPISIMGNVF